MNEEKTRRMPASGRDKSADHENMSPHPDVQNENEEIDLGKTKVLGKDKPSGTTDDINLLTETDVYRLNDHVYSFKGLISENSGEAQIFLVERDGVNYVLKLYYPQFKPRMELLDKLRSFDFPGVVKLYDFGEWTNPKTGGKRTFELMEFLEGGELDKIKLDRDEARFRDIALQAASVLAFCHNNKIIHKDIKPGNFFFRDKEHKQLILGDFGIASLCSEDELSHQTQQARTPVYAAPEMYILIDDKVEIDAKVDFYSLGITLMYVWSGANPFRDNERAMTNMKRLGDLPYPEDAPADILLLMKGLTVLDPRKRWGFDEVRRWANGEIVEVAKNTLVRYNAFVFDADKGLAASNPQELALLMDKYPPLAIKYLYSNQIKNWLEESGDRKLAVEIFEICEKRYPQNHQAGLKAAIYLFNSRIVYKAADGSECENDEQMAAAFLKKPDHYAEILQNFDDDYYLYLEASGKLGQRNLYSEYFREFSPHVAIWKVIYDLDKTAPFPLEIQTEGGPVSLYCKAPGEIIVGFRENKVTKNGIRAFTDGRFMGWFANQLDPDTYQVIEKIIANGSENELVKVYAILYYLDRRVSFNLYLPGEDDSRYFFTNGQVARLFSGYARRKLQEKEENSYLDLCIDHLPQDTSLLYYYFESKGWDEEIKWVKYCFELDGDDNRKKCGPYNKEIALYKAIKGLGAEPSYWFPKSGAQVSSLDELEKIPADEIVHELRKGPLKNWLTIFYQEDPQADLKLKFVYEKLTHQYLLKLEQLDPRNQEAVRFREAIGETGSLRGQVKGKSRRLISMKFIFAVLFLFLSGLLFVWVVRYKIPVTVNPLPPEFWNASRVYFAIATVFLGTFTYIMSENRKFLSSLVTGAFESVVLYYAAYLAIGFFSPYLTIIVAALIILGVILFLLEAYGVPSSGREMRRELFAENDEETGLVEPLYHAFHPARSGFKSSRHDAFSNFEEELRRQSFSLNGWIIPGIVLFGILSAAFFILHPHFADSPVRKELVSLTGWKLPAGGNDKIIGTWTGTFDNKPSVLIFEEMDPDNRLKGNIGVQFKDYVREGFIGTFDNREKSVQFSDTIMNRLIDGTYSGSFSAGMDTLTGVYKSKLNGKFLAFKYVKKP